MAPVTGRRGRGAETGTEGPDVQPQDAADTHRSDGVSEPPVDAIQMDDRVELDEPVARVVDHPRPVVDAHSEPARAVQPPAKAPGGKSVAELMYFERRIIKRR